SGESYVPDGVTASALRRCAVLTGHGTSRRVKRARRPGDIAIVLALAGVYFAAAKLGLSMAFVADQVTAVGPPTGIAFAAVLLFGARVWPGILVGAFLANATGPE